MEHLIDSRIVRTIRSLRKLQSANESFSTRTSTPSTETQLIEVISNKEELSCFRESLQPSEILEALKNDQTVVRDLLTEPSLSSSQLKKITDRLSELIETKKIQVAKQSINAKIQERMENLKKQLEDSN